MVSRTSAKAPGSPRIEDRLELEELLHAFDDWGSNYEPLVSQSSAVFPAEFVKDYVKRGLVLILGAGVSCPIVPEWGQLLEQMATEHPDVDKETYEKLKEKHNPPAIAGIIDDLIARRTAGSFAKALRDKVYRNFKGSNAGLTDAEIRQLVEGGGLTTLQAVAAFCAVQDDNYKPSISYLPNPQVQAVISTNVDTILQCYANIRYPDRRRPPQAKAETRIFRTIERPASGPGRGINLYQMHGSIEFKRANRRLHDDASVLTEQLVFTEHQYFDRFDRPTSRFNYTFLYFLREFPCLFIGCSMIDDNIRRLLHYSKSQVAESYAREIAGKYRARAQKHREDSLGKIEEDNLIKDIDDEIKHARRKLHRHIAVVKKTDPWTTKWSTVDELRARALYRLGVQVLWTNDHPEIPGVLRYLYERGPAGTPGGTKRTWRDVLPETTPGSAGSH